METPTSIKCVLIVDVKVLLVRNTRNEWELPGGRPEAREAPEAALVREIAEELSIDVTVGPQIDAYDFEVLPGRTVRIVTYACTVVNAFEPAISHEHLEWRLFPVGDLPVADLPEGYRRSIESGSRARLRLEPPADERDVIA